MKLKTCRYCNEEKELKCFPPRGLKCNVCTNDYDRIRSRLRDPKKLRQAKLKLNYGITEEIYNTFLIFQDNRCAICKTDDPRGRRNRFHVDHCHKTGRIRGLLCNYCNKILGMAGDDLDGVLRFVRYLLPWDQSLPYVDGLERLGREWANNTHGEHTT